MKLTPEYATIIFCILYPIAAVKAAGISLTANISEDSNGRLCPEGVELLCITTDVSITSLSWFKNVTEDLIYLNYLFDTPDIFPHVIENIPSDTSISLVINNAALAGSNSQFINFNATLTASVEVLYNMGFRSLSCGSSNEMDLFNITKLDREVPSRPSIVSVDSVHNSTSSSLEQLTIQCERSIYTRTPCEYRTQNSYFNASVYLDGILLQTVVTDINDSNCNESICTIIILGFSTPFLGDGENVQILITGVNRFNESEAATFNNVIYPSIESNFDFSLVYINCETVAKCVMFTPLNATYCTIRYRTDSSYTDRMAALNQSVTLTELQDDTTYYLEAVFIINDEFPVTYRIGRYFTTGVDTCSQVRSTHIVAIIIPIIIIVFLIIAIAVVLLVVFILKLRSHSSGQLSYPDMKPTNSAPTLISASANPNIIPSKEHRMFGEEVDDRIKCNAEDEDVSIIEG